MEHELLKQRAEKLQIGKIRNHIFLCAGGEFFKCCQKEEGMESWNYLKKRIDELNLEVPIFRSKVQCLRLCTSGPIAVIYPEGIWYHSCTPEVLEKIIQTHLIGGEILKEYQIASCSSDSFSQGAE